MMTPKRLFLVLSLLCGILLAGIGATVYFGNKLLAAEANKIALARADDELIEQRKILKRDLEKAISDYAELKTLAAKFLPDSKNQDDLVAEFYKIAGNNNIEIGGLTFTASGEKVGTLSQTTPLKDAKNVLIFPFTVTSYTADFDQLIGFLQDMENNRRKLQITQIQLQPDPKTGDINVPAMAVESYIKGVVPSEKPANPQPTEND